MNLTPADLAAWADYEHRSWLAAVEYEAVKARTAPRSPKVCATCGKRYQTAGRFYCSIACYDVTRGAA